MKPFFITRSFGETKKEDGLKEEAKVETKDVVETEEKMDH